MSRKMILPFFLILFLASSLVRADVGSTIFEEQDNGSYDWEKSVIQATGFGISPSFINNQSQSMIMAREAAITTAQRRLMELIHGVQIDSKQRVRNVQIESDIIRKSLSGLLKGARIVEEESIDDKTYMVVMELQFYGKDGVVEAIFPSLEESSRSDNVDLDASSTSDYEDSNGEDYTSIIIEGPSNLKPALAPKVYSSDGELIYGISTVYVEGVIKDGLVSYSRSLEQASNSPRAGNNPLIIEAEGVRGEYYTDMVVSKRDARKIKVAGIRGIFNSRRVIVVLN